MALEATSLISYHHRDGRESIIVRHEIPAKTRLISLGKGILSLGAAAALFYASSYSADKAFEWRGVKLYSNPVVRASFMNGLYLFGSALTGFLGLAASFSSIVSLNKATQGYSIKEISVVTGLQGGQLKNTPQKKSPE